MCQEIDKAIEALATGLSTVAKPQWSMQETTSLIPHTNYINICKQIRQTVKKGNWKEHVRNLLHQVMIIKSLFSGTKKIVTDRTKPFNKPDIKLRDRKGICLLIDVSIPSDKNV